MFDGDDAMEASNDSVLSTMSCVVEVEGSLVSCKADETQVQKSIT
jgi:hypothetical protein